MFFVLDFVMIERFLDYDELDGTNKILKHSVLRPRYFPIIAIIQNHVMEIKINQSLIPRFNLLFALYFVRLDTCTILPH